MAAAKTLEFSLRLSLSIGTTAYLSCTEAAVTRASVRQTCFRPESYYQIVGTKQPDPKAEVSALETEIDQLVYSLYGITREEIAVIEESLQEKKPAGKLPTTQHLSRMFKSLPGLWFQGLTSTSWFFNSWLHPISRVR